MSFLTLWLTDSFFFLITIIYPFYSYQVIFYRGLDVTDYMLLSGSFAVLSEIFWALSWDEFKLLGITLILLRFTLSFVVLDSELILLSDSFGSPTKAINALLVIVSNWPWVRKFYTSLCALVVFQPTLFHWFLPNLKCFPFLTFSKVSTQETLLQIRQRLCIFLLLYFILQILFVMTFLKSNSIALT